MRLIFTAALLLVLHSAPAHAQLFEQAGIKVGASYSDVEYHTATERFDVSRGRRLGLSVVGFAESNIAPYTNLVIEAGYVQRGFESKYSLSHLEYEVVTEASGYDRFDYFTLATFIKLRPLPSDGIGPYLFAGPYLSFLLGSNNDFTDRYASPSAFGGAAGFGIAFPTLPVPLYIESRYTQDFTDSLPYQFPELYHTSFDLVLGIGLK